MCIKRFMLLSLFLSCLFWLDATGSGSQSAVQNHVQAGWVQLSKVQTDDINHLFCRVQQRNSRRLTASSLPLPSDGGHSALRIIAWQAPSVVLSVISSAVYNIAAARHCTATVHLFHACRTALHRHHIF